MMKKNLFKSWLLTTALFLVAVASQAENVIYERGYTTAWSDNDLSSWTASSCQPTINGGLNVTSTNGGWTLTNGISVTATTKVTLTAKLKTGGPSGRSGSYDYIKMGGVSICFNEQDKKATVDIDGTATEMSITYNRVSTYSVTISIDQDSHNVSAMIGTTSVNATSTTAISNVEFGHYKAGRENYAVNPVLEAIQISEEVSASTYYDYKVNAVDGSNNVLKELKSGTVESTSNQLDVFFPQHVLSGTTLYETAKATNPGWYQSSLTINEDDYVYDIPYTAGTVDDVVFYTEAEDVEGTSTANNLNRASCGHMGHTGGSYVDATTLEPGKYQIFMRGVNGNSGSRAVNFKVGDNVVFTTSITTGTNYLANSETFSVTANSTLSFSSEGSSASGVDWFYVKYMGELDQGTYTVKFMLDDYTTELKEAETRNGAIGTQPVIYESDKDIFTIDDVTYIYDSDDAAEQTIAEDGSTVVTIVYREARPLTYQVVAVDDNNNVLDVVAEGELLEGQSTVAYYTKAVNSEGKWYMIAQNTSDPYYGVNIEADQMIYKTYSESDIFWFSEVEDLSPSHSWAADGAYPSRYANGMAKRLFKNSYVKTNAFTSGVYTVTLRARNNGRNPGTLDLFLVDADGNLVEGSLGTFEEWTSAEQAEKSIANVTIPEGYAVAINNTDPTYNSNLELDYIYLTRTGDLPAVEVTISKYGYSTLYYSDRNLVVPEDLWAYGVSIEDGKAKLNPAGSVIPAGTGVVLEGTPDKTYTLTVTSDNGPAVESDLQGTDVTTEISEAGYKYYMLSVKNDNAKSLGFYYQVKGGASIENKGHCAYLAIEDEEGDTGSDQNTNGFPFFEQTDGISTIGNGEVQCEGTYTLGGVRVSDTPLQKGVYVRNGRKVVIK